MKKPSAWTVLSIFLMLVVVGGCAKKSVHFPQSPSNEGGSPLIQASPAIDDLFKKGEEGIPEEKVEEEGILSQQIAQDFSAQPFPFRGGKTGHTGTDPSSPLQPVYFDFDQATLTEEAKAILRQNAVWLKNNPEAKVQIEGHCDERGTDEYNLALGDRRAQVVKNYLVSLGIAPTRLATISYGEEYPVDPGHDETAWAKNRRAEFNILQGLVKR